MLQAMKIIGSSSAFQCASLPHSLTKPHPPSWLFLRNPIMESNSLDFQLGRGGRLGAPQVPRCIVAAPPPEDSSSVPEINYCSLCGGSTSYVKPVRDERLRAVCTNCGNIDYQNPKMVVGCIVEHENKILLCKRAIEPSLGRWTLPAGYMEIGESACEGAIRETLEEANAEAEVLSPFAQLDVPLLGISYIMFLAKLKCPYFSPGLESLECKLFEVEDIPFDYLAFSPILIILELLIEDRKAGSPKFHYVVINKWPHSAASDLHACTVVLHLTS